MASDEFSSGFPPLHALDRVSARVAAEELRATRHKNSLSERSSGDHSPKPNARLRVAEQAQEYIDTHYRDAVHLQDLCRVTSVGVRTLQRCFREHFQLTVSNYLKAIRLEAARRELAASRQEETSVTEIAMQSGCTHLGRFSVEFRERYGVSPRELLSRRSEQM